MLNNGAVSSTAGISPSSYYGFVRQEIAPLLPNSAKNILEVGAAAGGTLNWLRTKYPGASTTGVELNYNLLPQLKNNADKAIIGSIDNVLDELDYYDLILILDVLEHLDDSLKTLSNIASKLSKGGKNIISLPNVAHYSVSLPLLFQRNFEYTDAGILDRTHKVFFTEGSAIKLINDAGLIVRGGLLAGPQGPKSHLINIL